MKSKDYWKKRSEDVASKQFKKTDDYILSMQLEYQEALNSIQKDIEVFYARFAQNNEITLADARQLLNSNQLNEFKMDLKEFTRKAKNNKNQQWEKELNNVSYKVRVTRLQALQTQVRNNIELLYSKQLEGTTELLKGVYKDTYYRNIYEVHKGLGIGVNFSKLDNRATDKVMSEPWHGGNYSSRIWDNKEKLAMELQTNLTQAFIRGDSIDKTSKVIAERMGVARSRAITLVNTESAYITSKATFDSYSGSGVVKQYEILATLDLHTSKICRSMDGKVFKVSEKEIGVNAPPFHPRCRTTTVAYFEDMDTWLEQRIARNPDTDKNYYEWSDMTYDKWHKKYVEFKEDIPKYEAKTQGWIDNYKKSKIKDKNIVSEHTNNDIISNKKWLNANFSNQKRFESHFKHLSEYGNLSPEEYLNIARKLLSADLSEDVEGFVSKQGWIFKYRKSTNDFAMGHPKGTISTLFKPKEKYDYFLSEKEKYK